MSFFKRKRKYCLMEKVEKLSIIEEKENYLSKLELRNINEEKSKMNETHEDVARRIFRVFFRWSITPEEAKDLVMDCLTGYQKETLDESKIDSCLKHIIDSFYYQELNSNTNPDSHLRRKKKWMKLTE